MGELRIPKFPTFGRCDAKATAAALFGSSVPKVIFCKQLSSVRPKNYKNNHRKTFGRAIILDYSRIYYFRYFRSKYLVYFHRPDLSFLSILFKQTIIIQKLTGLSIRNYSEQILMCFQSSSYVSVHLLPFT